LNVVQHSFGDRFEWRGGSTTWLNLQQPYINQCNDNNNNNNNNNNQHHHHQQQTCSSNTSLLKMCATPHSSSRARVPITRCRNASASGAARSAISWLNNG
jgi:hypothetical protein